MQRHYSKRCARERAEAAWMDFVRMVFKGLRRTDSYLVVSRDLDIDQLYYRDESDIAYIDCIKDPEGYDPSWEDCITVAGNECLRLGVQLLAEYKQYRPLDSYRVRPLSWQRDARKRDDFLVLYWNIEIYRISSDYIARLYVAPHPMWHRDEVPYGMLVELSPILSYYTTCFLKRLDATFWRMFFTEWCALVATAWLCELCGTFRMWFIPFFVREQLSRLDLDTVLEDPTHVADFHSHLARYETIDWNDPNMVPLANNRRKPRPLGVGEGRRHATCGDYVWYNPFEWAITDENVAIAGLALPCHLSPTAPRGYVYVPGDLDAVAAQVPMIEAPADASSGPSVQIPSDIHSADERLPVGIRDFLKSCGLSADLADQGRDAVTTWVRNRFNDSIVAKDPTAAELANQALPRSTKVTEKPVSVGSFDPFVVLKTFLEKKIRS